MALKAERLGLQDWATFNRRHHSAARPAHIAAFDLLLRPILASCPAP